MKHSKKTPKKQLIEESELPLIHPQAAGADIGDREIWIAVPPELDDQPIRMFNTFTPNMQQAVAWLVRHGIKTIAMEATGIYWFAFYSLLEEAGINPYVVNGQHTKQVPGRKADPSDANWIRKLHTYGLLNNSFFPPIAIRQIRHITRHRQMLTQYRASHIQHIQKALQQMNIKLTTVVSDIVGKTSLQILRAIIDGETDPETLLAFRSPQCQASPDDFIAALTGNYEPALIFNLKQAVDLFDYYGQCMQDCDAQLQTFYAQLETKETDNPDPIYPSFYRRKNQPFIDFRHQFFRIFGVNLLDIPGLSVLTLQTILAEVGTDLSPWPTSRRFCSWLGLSPNNDSSGGKVLRRRTTKNANRVAHALRIAAQTLARHQGYLGSCYRSFRARLGPQKAITAIAHKLARIIYAMMTSLKPYQPPNMHAIDEKKRARALARLDKQAAKHNCMLVPIT